MYSVTFKVTNFVKFAKTVTIHLQNLYFKPVRNIYVLCHQLIYLPVLCSEPLKNHVIVLVWLELN